MGEAFYPRSVQPSYRHNFRSARHYRSSRGFRGGSLYDSYKRGPPLDRLSMGFIKRNGGLGTGGWNDDGYGSFENNDLDAHDLIGNELPYEKRRSDTIAPTFIRKKRSLDEGLVHAADLKGMENNEKHTVDDSSTTEHHSDTNSEGNEKEAVENEKRRLDRIRYSLVKKEFDRLGSTLVKKNDDNNVDKRQLDRLSYALVKKSEDESKMDVDKRRLDRLSNIFIKKDFGGGKLDRLSSGFIKKRLDRLSSFIKKDEPAEKRRLDRLRNGFIEKGDKDDKRRVDRLSNVFIKKDNGGMDEKRHFDRFATFIKKDDSMETDKRRLSRLTNGFIKKNANNEVTANIQDNSDDAFEKRRLDRLRDGFIKKSDSMDNDKRHFGRISNAFIKKSDEMNEDIGSDSLSPTEFIKKEYETVNDDYLQKRRLDRVDSGLIRRSSPDVDIPEEYTSPERYRRSYDLDQIGYEFIKRAEEPFPYAPAYPVYGLQEKRRLSRLGGFIKRNV